MIDPKDFGFVLMFSSLSNMSEDGWVAMNFGFPQKEINLFQV